MGYIKISPPWDSNKGYISECVLSKLEPKALIFKFLEPSQAKNSNLT